MGLIDATWFPGPAFQARLAHAHALRRARRPVEARAHAAALMREASDAGHARVARKAGELVRLAGGRLRADARPRGLTPAEVRVADILARGAPTGQIAAELVLSARTIEGHLRNIYRKLGVNDRASAAAEWAAYRARDGG